MPSSKPSEHSIKPSPSHVDVSTGQLLSTPLKRQFSLLSIISVGYNISNSWVAIATSFAIAIQSGGALSLLYGIIAVAVAMLATGTTLAELASVYPTAGGQYHFTSALATNTSTNDNGSGNGSDRDSDEGWGRGLSYFSGLAALGAWITLAASIALAATNALMAIVVRWAGEYMPQRWHYFLVYEGLNVLTVGYNVLLMRKTVWVYNVGFLLSLSTFLVITIACPSRSASQANIDTHNVWTHFVNGSGGWPDGVSFLTGLSTPQFMLSGLDATLHLAEEALQPERIVPKAVMVTVLVGFMTAFPFAVAMIYSYSDVQASLGTRTGFPIFFIWEKATHSSAAATVFMAALFVVSCVALNAVHQTASRLTWSLARDEAIVFSGALARVYPGLEVPVSSIVGNGALVMVLGVVYVASSTAFNAFISTTVIVAQISYAVPAALVVARRRSTDYLPATRPFKVPHWIGYPANVLTIVWAVILTVFFTFPTEFPVTGGNMNYASVVLVVMLILGIVNWLVYARKHYQGPRLEM